MKLIADQSFKLVGVQKKVSKKTGNEYELIELADPEKFERYEFYRNDRFEFGPGVQVGDSVKAVFDINKIGFNTNLNLIKLTK